jgi:autotransporter adhesin
MWAHRLMASRSTSPGTSGNRQLTGVANGSVSATSSDAVSGSQLYATNTAVAATTGYATVRRQTGISQREALAHQG